MTKTMKTRIDLLTEVQEYVISTNEYFDSCYAMDLCSRIQTLKREMEGGGLLEERKGEEIPE